MDVLAAYDAQVRTSLAHRPPRGVDVPLGRALLCCTDLRYRGFVGCRSLEDVDDVAALIARTVAFFAARGEAFGVRGADWPWPAGDLAARDPSMLTVLIAQAGDSVVSAGWLVYNPGTVFAGLWGGSTLLERLGFLPITTTTPYVWTPPR